MSKTRILTVLGALLDNLFASSSQIRLAEIKTQTEIGGVDGADVRQVFL